MTRRAAGVEPLLFPENRDLPVLPASAGVCVGVDVGGIAKGFHAVALLGDGAIATFRSARAEAVVDWCIALDAATIGVDAPCAWSATGRSRAAERALQAEGIHSYATPTFAKAAVTPFYGWMMNGAGLYARLAHRFEAYRGAGAPSRMYFETYPQAVACALAGRIVSARDKRAVRRTLLTRAGVPVGRLTNIDYVDAALCALAAAYARAGHYRAYGDRREGHIVVPGSRSVRSPEA